MNRALTLLLVIVAVTAAASDAEHPLAVFDSNNDGILQCHELVGDDAELLGACERDPSRQSALKDLGDVKVTHQIHLQQMDDPNSMQVRWVTVDVERKEQARVAFRKANTTSTAIVDGIITTYDVGDGIGWHGWIYTVHLLHLEEDTTYEYQIDAEFGTNTWHSFTTLPRASPASTMVTRIACSGDIGTVIPAGFRVSKAMLKYHREVAPLLASVAVGDLAYAGTSMPAPTPHNKNKLRGGGEIEAVWDVFGSQIEELNSEIPLIPVVGNHEKFYNYTSYRYRYTEDFWFARQIGNVFIVSFSTQHPYGPESEQGQWLEATLARAQQEQWPWVILFTHRPMYASDVSEHNQHTAGAPLQQTIEPLLLKYNVSLMVEGHMHLYERVYPVRDGVPEMTGTNVYVNPQWTPHVVQGTGGCFYIGDKWEPQQPAWSAMREFQYGFGVIEANTTVLNYRFWSLEHEQVIDEFSIVHQ